MDRDQQRLLSRISAAARKASWWLHKHRHAPRQEIEDRIEAEMREALLGDQPPATEGDVLKFRK